MWEKYLQKYVNKYLGKQESTTEQISGAVQAMLGKRLSYKELT